MEADEPRSFGGTDAAQSPVELLLTSLATCQAITYRLWAAELGIALDRVGVEVTGDLDLSGFLGTDDGARAGYEGLRIQVTLEGPDGAIGGGPLLPQRPGPHEGGARVHHQAHEEGPELAVARADLVEAHLVDDLLDRRPGRRPAA